MPVMGLIDPASLTLSLRRGKDPLEFSGSCPTSQSHPAHPWAFPSSRQPSSAGRDSRRAQEREDDRNILREMQQRASAQHVLMVLAGLDPRMTGMYERGSVHA